MAEILTEGDVARGAPPDLRRFIDPTTGGLIVVPDRRVDVEDEEQTDGDS